MSERGTGRLIGDAALSEVITFRCTKSDKQRLEQARKDTGYPSIGHYVRAVALQRQTFYGQIFGEDEEGKKS